MQNIGIAYMMDHGEKPLHWIGSSHRELCDFPDAARREAGYNLGRLQNGRMPVDWKPMETVGPGTYEIRVSTNEGDGRTGHRVFYVAKFDEAIYVLHAFAKKTQRTPQHHIEVGRARYRQMLERRRKLSSP